MPVILIISPLTGTSPSSLLVFSSCPHSHQPTIDQLRCEDDPLGTHTTLSHFFAMFTRPQFLFLPNNYAWLWSNPRMCCSPCSLCSSPNRDWSLDWQTVDGISLVSCMEERRDRWDHQGCVGVFLFDVLLTPKAYPGKCTGGRWYTSNLPSDDSFDDPKGKHQHHLS